MTYQEGITKSVWDIPFDERVSSFIKKSSKKRIVFLYEKADYGTFRYRVYNVCQTLNKTEEYSGTYFFESEFKDILDIIEKADAVVLARVPWSFDLEALIQKLYIQGTNIIYDTDDLVFDINKTPLLMNYLHANTPADANGWFGYVGRRYLAASRCFNFITTNEYLANEIKQFFNKDVHIIPNYMNDEQIEVSLPLYEERINKSIDTTKISIGYFSGTGSHNNDFRVAASAIKKLMDKYKNLFFKVVGFLSIPPELSEYEIDGRIERMDLVTFTELQKLISECYVNIIPLVENEFTNSKSELKFFESAIVGTPSVASPTFVYKKAIKDGETGLIANTGEWDEKLEKLISDINLYKTIQKNAFEYSLENYYGEKITQTVVDVFKKLVK